MVSLLALFGFPLGASYLLVILYSLTQWRGSKSLNNKQSQSKNIVAAVLHMKEDDVRNSDNLDQMRGRITSWMKFIKTFVIFWPILALVLIPLSIIFTILSPFTTKKSPIPVLARVWLPQNIPKKHVRKYDIVLFGGTGSCGRGCLEFLSERYLKNKEIKVAVCARNEKKMLRIIDEMKRGWEEKDLKVNNWMHPDASVDVLVADAMNIESVREVVQQAKLVLNTVGPFVKLGNNIIQASCECGADYVDVTGEFGWIMGMRYQLYNLAALNGSRIFNACGYDVIPVECSSNLAAAAFKTKYNRSCKNIIMAASSRGAIGGGTLNTLKELMDHPLKNSPYVGKKFEKKMHYSYSFFSFDSKYFKKWLHTYFFGPVDGNFLKYSNRQRGTLPDGVKITECVADASFCKAFVEMVMITTFHTVLLIPFLRPVISRFGPPPGAGLGRKIFTKGWCKITSIAADGSDQVMVEAGTQGDPAYGATCQYAVETAMAILKPEEDDVVLPSPGFHTPFAGLGMGLVRRLYRTGTMAIKVQ